MRLDVVTIFPDYLAPLELSLVGKARERGLLDVRVHDLREFTHDVHRTVDDTPYGGGPGMVMRPEPWGEALDDVGARRRARRPGSSCRRRAGARSPRRWPHELADEPWLMFACGRYEGIDARVAEHARRRMRVDEVSIGDYVLNGGEVAVLVIVEAVVRLLPGVIGNAESLVEESHVDGLLEARRTPSRPAGGASTCRTCCCPVTTGRSLSGGGGRALRRTADLPPGPRRIDPGFRLGTPDCGRLKRLPARLRSCRPG